MKVVRGKLFAVAVRFHSSMLQGKRMFSSAKKQQQLLIAKIEQHPQFQVTVLSPSDTISGKRSQLIDFVASYFEECLLTFLQARVLLN